MCVFNQDLFTNHNLTWSKLGVGSEKATCLGVCIISIYKCRYRAPEISGGVVFRVVMPHSEVVGYQRFGGPHCL